MSFQARDPLIERRSRSHRRQLAFQAVIRHQEPEREGGEQQQGADQCQPAPAGEQGEAGELREAERLPGFVSSMARNLFLGSARRGGRRQKWQGGPEAAETAPDPAPGQLAWLLAQERAAMVRQVLAELKNDRDREILARYYIADQDKEVICHDFELTDLHFNRVLFRARQRYRELFERRQENG